RNQRITIGEGTSGEELEEILNRYPAGADVIVYYDPANPQTAVLERDLPLGKLLAGVGCLLLFFVGGPALAIFLYFHGVAWLEAQVVDPKRAPFVAAATGFGILTSLFALGFMRMVQRARNWPIAPGRVVASGIETVLDNSGDGPTRLNYKSYVMYSYEVNGRQYTGDHIVTGMTTASTVPAFAKRQVRRYPVGRE